MAVKNIDVKNIVLADCLDDKSKQLWVKDVVELVKADLKREYDISFDDLKVAFKESYEISGSYSKGEIRFYNMLESNNVIDDLMTIAHELRHYAQEYGKIKDLGADEESLSKHYLPPDTSIIESYFDLKNLRPDDKKDLKTFNLQQRLKAFLCKGYYGNELEMDARGYSLNFVDNLLKDIKQKYLTKKEKDLLEDLTKKDKDSLKCFTEEEVRLFEDRSEALTQAFETENDIMMWLESGDKQTDSACVRQIKSMQKEILNSEKFKSALKSNLQGNSLMIALGSLYLKGIIQSLEFAYNDDLAHKMFSNFASSYSAIPGWNYLFLTRLYSRTKIELTEDEETKFSSIIARRNKNKNVDAIRKGLDSERQNYLSQFDEEYKSVLPQGDLLKQ